MHRIFRLTFILLLTATFSYSQSAKKFFASGEKFQESGNYKDAIENYTKALQVDPNYEKAYVSRAVCYEKTGEKADAAEDYRRAIAFSPKEKEYYYHAGRLYFDLGKYPESDQMLKSALERDKGYAEAIDIRIKVLHKLKNFQEGLAVAELGVDVKKTGLALYNRAVMLDSLKKYDLAEKEYKEAKYYDSKLIPAYVGLALVQLKLNKTAEALKVCEDALLKSPNSVDVFNARSLVNAQKGDYTAAVNDLTKVISEQPDNLRAFYLRANYYQKISQFQNAINDYTKCILANDKSIDAYLSRAKCHEQLANHKAAIKDYEKYALLSPNNPQAQAVVKDVKAKLYELNRETYKPEIAITVPKASEKNVIRVQGDKDEIIVKGSINDASLIKSISLDGAPADFEKDSLNPDFSVKATGMVKKTEITVSATDVYDNTQKVIYTLEKTEVNKPVVALIAPYTSFDNEIVLDNSNSELYIEGKVKDESLIESIIVEGVNASFQSDAKDPGFSTKLNISNKFKITVKVRDVYGNETNEEYKLNRDGATMAKDNPMGNTWVIFIENTTYQNFGNLEGPTKDVVTMKAALANYKINKVVHKRNMSKSDLEKFFSIELRDLARSNNINSLLIWYAGHGKFVSNTGYWIPVDAKTNDEFSYFSINNLRAAMQSYQRVVHTLVITDACESGPTFLLAMRDGPTEKRCDNWELTKFKSAQVFSSAGYELAADLSQFTKTFAATLNNNPDGCIAIEKVAEKVGAAVKATGNQAPKLGKINGLEDEGGSFFFMKK